MGVVGCGPVPVMVVGWVLVAIATGVIFARIYLRLKIQRRRLLVSDALMAAAWVFAVAEVSTHVIMMNLGGLDKGVGTTPVGFHGNSDKLQAITKAYWFSQIPFFVAVYLCKAALLSMYLEIFPVFMRKRRIFSWMTICYNILALVATLVVTYRLCYPIDRLWDINLERACPGSLGKKMFNISWALNFAGDMLVFFLPWLVVPGLKIRTKLKIGLYATFLLGLITIMFSIIRFVYIAKSQVRDSVPYSTVMLWSTIEMNLGLIIACLPSLRPYLRVEEEKSRGYQGPSGSGDSSRRLESGAICSVAMHTLSNCDNLWDARHSNGSEAEIVEAKSDEGVPSTTGSV
ncbi:hypothetical protein EDB80DRAFT_895731 [Ilyonectria destructans]|nr:hypothetical protein EDB80DRAFT_895731 [Ilyonectria destructans]